ncbi:hypothetical protein F4808DRAFT_459625 [Astrocystis sublimbata]|nr:hypothetical protein F4808DRAFT_459625 [Astrocystis sublimbata]
MPSTHHNSPEDIWQLMTGPFKAPDTPEDFVVTFEKDNAANALIPRNSVGRLELTLSRTTSSPSNPRGWYEPLDLTMLRDAHVDLGLVLDHEFLIASLMASQHTVNGTVRCRAYERYVQRARRLSDTSKLYDASESSTGEIGKFSPQHTSGLISVNAVRLKKYGDLIRSL